MEEYRNINLVFRHVTNIFVYNAFKMLNTFPDMKCSMDLYYVFVRPH